MCCLNWSFYLPSKCFSLSFWSLNLLKLENWAYWWDSVVVVTKLSLVQGLLFSFSYVVNILIYLTPIPFRSCWTRFSYRPTNELLSYLKLTLYMFLLAISTINSKKYLFFILGFLSAISLSVKSWRGFLNVCHSVVYLLDGKGISWMINTITILNVSGHNFELRSGLFTFKRLFTWLRLRCRAWSFFLFNVLICVIWLIQFLLVFFFYLFIYSNIERFIWWLIILILGILW